MPIIIANWTLKIVFDFQVNNLNFSRTCQKPPVTDLILTNISQNGRIHLNWKGRYIVGIPNLQVISAKSFETNQTPTENRLMGNGKVTDEWNAAVSTPS